MSDPAITTIRARDWALDLEADRGAFGVVGEDRDAINALAYSLACLWDPKFLWISLEAADGAGPGALETKLHGRIPTERWLDLGPPETLGPDLEGARLALYGRSLAPLARIAADPRAMDLMGLPPAVRLLARRLHRLGRPNLAVIANLDRIAALYPNDPAGTRRYLRALMGDQTSLLLTYCGALRENRLSADAVMTAESDAGTPWPESRFRVEWANVGPLARDGAPFRLAEVPGSELLS